MVECHSSRKHEEAFAPKSPPKPGLGHRGVPGQSPEPLGNVVYINTQHLRIFSCILGWGISGPFRRASQWHLQNHSILGGYLAVVSPLHFLPLLFVPNR